MKFAIIATSGKQYKVTEGQLVTLDRMDTDGSAVAFDHVLVLADDDKVSIGTPELSGTSVPAEIVNHSRGPKVTVVKYKAKVRYRRKHGHRQDLTTVRIGKIPSA